MRRTTLKLVLGATALMFSCYLYTQTQEDEHDMTDLISSNVEALAAGEGTLVDVLCMGRGSVECAGYYVEEKIINYSLK